MTSEHTHAYERDPVRCPCHTTYGKLLQLSRRLPRDITVAGFREWTEEIEGRDYPHLEVLCVLDFNTFGLPYLDLLAVTIGESLDINDAGISIRHGSDAEVRHVLNEPGWSTFGDFND